MKRLEDQKAAEIQRQNEIQFALAFVETAKGLYFRDGSRTYFDYISEKLKEKQSAGNVPQASSAEQPAYQASGY